MKLLILDSGHSEYVPGKESPDKSFREWKFNNDMQYMILDKVKKCGIDVYLTNPNPNGIGEIGLTKRANLANDYYIRKGKCDSLFISIHANAYKGVFNDARGICEYFGVEYADDDKDVFYRVVCGSFRDKENAKRRIEELKECGFDNCFVLDSTV